MHQETRVCRYPRPYVRVLVLTQSDRKFDELQREVEELKKELAAARGEARRAR